MARKRSIAKDDAERRRELGGYSDAEFDAEFARSHRSDVVSIAIRVVTLIVVFAMLARAIRSHDLPPWLLLLPMAFEMLLIFWIGWILSRFVVSCPAFRKSAGRFALVLFWSVAIIGAGVAAILFNPGGESNPDSFKDGVAGALQWILRTDLHWALLAMTAALLASTSQEVTRWRQEHGVFVWASIMNAGFRIGILFLLGFFGFIIALVTGGWLVEYIAETLFAYTGRPLVWAFFGGLLIVEIITLVVSTLMHRETLAKRAATGPARKSPA